MGKFKKLLNRNGEEIIEGRAKRILTSAENAQESIIRNLVDEVNALEDKRDLMLDQSPDNSFSLTVGKDFEAGKWAKEYHSLSVQLMNKKVELAIARENQEDLFSDAKPTTKKK